MASLMEAYPGGWQTVFPNGGDACVEQGVEWGMHGEAWLAPWDVVDETEAAVTMQTRLVRSPFALTKTIAVTGDTVNVRETVHNEGKQPVEVMWSHHPAFGRPFIGPDCRIETSARTFVVDDARVTDSGDLQVGARASWPLVPAARAEATVDVSRLPGEEQAVDRFGYLTDFDGPAWAAFVNDELGITARLEWDADVMPHAWYWLEAHGSTGFPWYRGVYVAAIEPATSFPGRGIATVRTTTANQIRLMAGERRTTMIRLQVTGHAGTDSA